jgi:ADP-heptose:LPS heptosyltransferase
LDRWIRYVYFQSEVHRYLETVALVGARAIRWEPWVCVTPRDREAAGAVLREGDAPLVIIHPGASDPRRHWPAERFAVVADQLAAEGFQIALVGTKPEAALIQAVLHGMQAPATNLCDQLTLGALAALLQRAALVIANDSGPAHLAAAVGAKAVVIYWVGNLINAGPLSRRRVRPVISFRTQCLRCGRDCVTDPCNHSETFVGDVKVDRVIAEALDLLACDVAPRVLRSQPLTLNGS